MRKTCLDMIYELAKKDSRIVFIGSDLGAGTLKQFQEEIPERFFMEGISEANVVGMAAGFAMEGKIPYVNTISSFITRRSFEQIVLDVCLHNLKVRLIGNGGGLVYAPLGPTHMTVEDIAIMRAIPNMSVVAVADSYEMKKFMPQTVDYSGPIYIRLAKGYDPLITNNKIPFKIGKAIPMREGKDILIITTGITLKLALECAVEAKSKGIEISVLHMPTIKPLDTDSILEYAKKVSLIIVIEEHSIIGGLGSAIAEVIAEANFCQQIKYKRIGISDMFPDEYGSQASLMERFKITKEHLVQTIHDMF